MNASRVGDGAWHGILFNTVAMPTDIEYFNAEMLSVVSLDLGAALVFLSMGWTINTVLALRDNGGTTGSVP